jgi:ribonuclease HII
MVIDSWVCGVDEAGRGPLAGPVYAAAVILDPHQTIEGLDDSKKLSEKKREQLATLIKERAKVWAIASASVQEIDALNILKATFLAMQRAIQQLSQKPHLVLVDGNRAPDFGITTRCIVGGDRLEPAISAASILAKTARDAEMLEIHARYPEWGFDQHKGYPTQAHRELLLRLPLTPEHRLSFAPVRAALSLNTALPQIEQQGS